MAQHDNTTALYAALFGNLAIAITKFIAEVTRIFVRPEPRPQ